MADQLEFHGLPVKDSEARLSGKFYLSEGEAPAMHEDTFYVVRARCDSITGETKSYDRIGGVREVYSLEAQAVVRVTESQAAQFLQP